jgi:hypothetical protein
VKEDVFKEINRIRDELSQIDTIVSHAQRDWNEFIRRSDEAFLKAVAYDLHGFYTGLERIFKSVANTIDDRVPAGENWHMIGVDIMVQQAEKWTTKNGLETSRE